MTNPVWRRSLRSANRRSAATGSNVAPAPASIVAACSFVRSTGNPTGARSTWPSARSIGAAPGRGATPIGTNVVGSTAGVPAGELAEQAGADDGGIGLRRPWPVLRMKRPVGAMNRRIAGSIDASGRLVGPIAARTEAPAIGVRPVSGLANVSTSAVGSTASDLACRRIDASIDSRARDSRALALSTAPTCCQHAVINVLLLAAHDLGTEPGGDPGPRVEVGLGEPAVVEVGDVEAVGRPGAVQRRADGAVVGVGARTGRRCRRAASASGWRSAVGTSPITPSSWPRARNAPSISMTWSGCPSGRSTGPPAAPMCIFTVPTVGTPSSDSMTNGLSRRASDSKSPSGPVANDQWKYTGRVIESCSVHAGSQRAPPVGPGRGRGRRRR